MTGAPNGNGFSADFGMRRSFPARPGSVAQARRAMLALPLSEDACERLQLLVSEVVTNSVRHAGDSAYDPAQLDDQIDLLVTHDEDVVTVAIHDRGSGFSPPPPPPTPNGGPTEGGLGLMIVDALSTEWGVEKEDDGCTVWFTLAAPQSTRGA